MSSPLPGSRRVVVTGLGALTPIGNTVPAFWQAMMEGTSGATPITNFDASDYRTTFACELKEFDVEEHIDRKEARKLDPFCQFSIVAADEALKDAAVDTTSLSEEERDRTGVIFGSGIGGMELFEDQVRTYIEKGPRRLSPFFVPMMIVDMAAGQISMRHNLRGPNYAVVSACATGNNAIGDAFMVLKTGLAKMVVCGGSDASVTPVGVGGFMASRALSTRNDDPATASRPFDAGRDGFVMGEGAGAMVLETLEHAQNRGARIYAELVGLGMSADAYHITAPHPEGIGAKLAMQMALDTAGIAPTEVDYINMHGTSTPLGDIAETKAIKDLFGDHAYEVSLSSTKSMTGHLLGAAGAVEAIASILAIKNDTIPPTINFSEPDPECDLDYTFNDPKEKPVRVALSNAFGFGGHNTCLVFKEMSES